LSDNEVLTAGKRKGSKSGSKTVPLVFTHVVVEAAGDRDRWWSRCITHRPLIINLPVLEISLNLRAE
jgi:hypothetical protein